MLSVRVTTNYWYKPIKFMVSSRVLAHSTTCPTGQNVGRCPGSGGGPSKLSGPTGSSIKLPDFKRREKSGPVRFAFIPEEWFLFFQPITGVSGFYFFGLNLCNYCLSKEIFVMEHEYYVGLSIFVMLCVLVTKSGAEIGASLDKEVDAIQADWEKTRIEERTAQESIISAAQEAQKRAQGQKILMDAKKENIAMQLEAAYRERMMHVYRTVTGRMEYHVKRTRAENRIHQKWMLAWILNNVRKSITPEFEKQALDSAIRDLAAAASKA